MCSMKLDSIRDTSKDCKRGKMEVLQLAINLVGGK